MNCADSTALNMCNHMPQASAHYVRAEDVELKWRYRVGMVVGLWSDLGLSDLWRVCLDKIAR